MQECKTLELGVSLVPEQAALSSMEPEAAVESSADSNLPGSPQRTSVAGVAAVASIEMKSCGGSAGDGPTSTPATTPATKQPSVSANDDVRSTPWVLDICLVRVSSAIFAQASPVTQQRCAYGFEICGLFAVEQPFCIKNRPASATREFCSAFPRLRKLWAALLSFPRIISDPVAMKNFFQAGLFHHREPVHKGARGSHWKERRRRCPRFLRQALIPRRRYFAPARHAAGT